MLQCNIADDDRADYRITA